MSDMKIIQRVVAAVHERDLVDRVAQAGLRMADVNDYGDLASQIKAHEADLMSAVTLTDQYQKAITEKIDDSVKAVASSKEKLEAMGINFKPLARWVTMATNALKEWKKSPCNHSYVKSPSSAALDAFSKLVGNAAKQTENKAALSQTMKPVALELTKAKDLLDDWRGKITDLDLASSYQLRVVPEPWRSGFGPNPEREKYEEAQRAFAEASEKVLNQVREDTFAALNKAEDPKDLLKSAAKGAGQLYKMHVDFGREWGDYRATLKDHYDGQKSMF